jgi:hypothetical protein
MVKMGMEHCELNNVVEHADQIIITSTESLLNDPRVKRETAAEQGCHHYSSLGHSKNRNLQPTDWV